MAVSRAKKIEQVDKLGAELKKVSVENPRKALLGKRPMTKVGRAVEKGETQGFMKVVVDAETKEILGAATHPPKSRGRTARPAPGPGRSLGAGRSKTFMTPGRSYSIGSSARQRARRTSTERCPCSNRLLI